MTYNVFSGTLNPTHFTSLHLAFIVAKADVTPAILSRNSVAQLPVTKSPTQLRMLQLLKNNKRDFQ